MVTHEGLSERFLQFAEMECKGSSLLYEHLSTEIAGDDELLILSAKAGKGQPVPNLLFGAVHFLLLKGTDHPLKEFYPSIVDNPKHYNAAFPAFKDFCLAHRPEIERLLEIGLVQTNEVRRCAYLYPIFCTIYEKVKKPLALIEIGTSSGLQLLWDLYSYSYGQNKRYGNLDSDLHLTADILGENTPLLHGAPPPVSERIGIDLSTIDLTDQEEKNWLKALIWPEHKERLAMFEKAAVYVEKTPLQLHEGDALRLLPDMIRKVSEDHALCIFHTHVANQMPVSVREQLLQLVEEIGRRRDVFHIYNNIQDKYLHLDYYLGGVENKQKIAETDGHGRWFRWFMKQEDISLD